MRERLQDTKIGCKSVHAASPEPPTGTLDQAVACMGLSTLRGVGVYYTESGHGVPPVMWHLLRNIEAVHEFVILLQVRPKFSEPSDLWGIEI